MFEVGKKVIAIKDHSRGIFKRGDIFELLAIKKSPCTCKPFVFDIGIPGNAAFSECNICHKTWRKQDSIWWFNCTGFAPYDDSLSDMTVDELIESLTLETV